MTWQGRHGCVCIVRLNYFLAHGQIVRVSVDRDQIRVSPKRSLLQRDNWLPMDGATSKERFELVLGHRFAERVDTATHCAQSQDE